MYLCICSGSNNSSFYTRVIDCIFFRTCVYLGRFMLGPCWRFVLYFTNSIWWVHRCTSSGDRLHTHSSLRQTVHSLITHYPASISHRHNVISTRHAAPAHRYYSRCTLFRTRIYDIHKHMYINPTRCATCGMIMDCVSKMILYNALLPAFM